MLNQWDLLKIEAGRSAHYRNGGLGKFSNHLQEAPDSTCTSIYQPDLGNPHIVVTNTLTLMWIQ